jgi:protein arginine kinase activator
VSERPLECSHCKKPVKILYKEIVQNSIARTEMCEDCPILQQRLHGTPPKLEGKSEAEMGLCCGRCGTSLDSVKMGNPLGCVECYSVFGDLLIHELILQNRIPERLKKSLASNKNQPIHSGKSPEKAVHIPATSQLTALNEALNEALKKENYEQAAWLRDQIKALMEKRNDTKS